MNTILADWQICTQCFKWPTSPVSLEFLPTHTMLPIRVFHSKAMQDWLPDSHNTPFLGT
jgi:hypothetical protein